MNSIVKHTSLITLAAALFLLSACSEPTKPAASADADAAKEAAAPIEPVTARTALWPMYTSARTWTTDFVILKMEPKELTAFKNDAGKAAMWEATFASPGRHEYRVYSYAIAAQPPDIYKGVTVGRPIPWSGETRDVMAIPLSDFKVDSDSAYKTALVDAGPWLKKNPTKKISEFQLWHAFRFDAPVWFLQWGDKKVGFYAAYVNATEGQLINKK
jgi:hypothetical protein